MTHTFQDRATKATNAVAKELMLLMERKQSNLCVAADVTNKEQLLRLAEAVGPHTHVDIVQDFDDAFLHALQRVAEKHDFMLFEDRKFADIGNTAKLQYTAGVYKIASWAHLITCHTLPGPALLTTLASAVDTSKRGCLLLAELSCKPNLITPDYTQLSLKMADECQDFVAGYIASRRLNMDEEGDGMLWMTPGVALEDGSDGMGQVWRGAHSVVYEGGSDVIIVGRAIYAAPETEWMHQAQRFQQAAWQAYISRQSKSHPSADVYL